jgi:heavy metal translocating P-type ATPase
MAFLVTAALAGAASAALVFETKRKRHTRIKLAELSPPGDDVRDLVSIAADPVRQKMLALRSQITETLQTADDHYQIFVRDKIDPVLMGGHSRNQQMSEFTGNSIRELTPNEKLGNRRMGLAIAGVSLYGLSVTTGLPLLPAVVAIGIYNLWPWFKEAYDTAVEEKKLKIIHMLGLYFGCMWVGGFYLAGILGSLFAVICTKTHQLTQMTARTGLTNVFGQQPSRVWIEVDGVEVEIAFTDIKTGDILVLCSGQMVPVDGSITEGEAQIDQHRLTGESQPVEKTAGDAVLATSVIIGGKIKVKVEKTGSDTAAAQIASILQNTVNYDSDRMGSFLASTEYTLWPMLAGGALGWLLAGPVAGMAILGCNYVVGIVPLRMIALLNALNSGSQRGILVKEGKALETVKKLDVLVFDKTGTLTQELPHIVCIHACNEFSADEVLMLAATAEHRQTHPIALAILEAARTRGLETLPITDNAYEVGYGLRVKLEDGEILVGSQRYMGMEQITLPDSLQPVIERCRSEGQSLVYVARNGVLAGAVEMDATLRPETPEVIQWFKKIGIKVYIMSGDQESPTRKLAETLGVDGYFANVLPDGKAALIEKLQADGATVGFVGDGINDAVALRTADVSISFRSATNVASDNARIVLMDDNLKQLEVLFELAEGFNRSLEKNHRQAVTMSLVAAAGALVLPYKFLLVEGLWVVEFASGIGIATRPVVDSNQTTR